MASSLSSRASKLANELSSFEVGVSFKRPTTTTPDNAYETIAQEMTTAPKNAGFDTNQVKTIVNGKTSLLNYEDFSSLTLRLATQAGSSVSGPESTEKAVTTDEHIALEEMMVTEIAAHDSGAAIQENTNI